MFSVRSAAAGAAPSTIPAPSMTIRAVVADSALPFRRRIIEAKCPASSSMQDAMLKLRESAVFATAVSGMQYIKAIRDDGKWISATNGSRDVDGAIFRPAQTILDGNETVSSFLRDGLASPQIDIHVIIYLPSEHLPHDYDIVVAQLHRIKVSSTRFIPAHVMPGDTIREDVSCVAMYRRHAESVVLDMLKAEVLACRGDLNTLNVSLVGSPGVGKSTLIQLLCWELMREGIDVFHLHRVRWGDVVLKFFSSKGHVIVGRVCGSSVKDLLEILSLTEGRTLSPLIILDGFSPSELTTTELFHIFVTSEGVKDPCSGSGMILLPSWSCDEVLSLNELLEENLVEELLVGFERGGRLGEKQNKMLAEVLARRYATFGGDLRSIFAQDQEQAERHLYAGISCVNGNTSHVMPSLYDRLMLEYVDSIQHYHVRDPTNPTHYRDRGCWVSQLESVSLQRALVKIAPASGSEEIFRIAKHTPLYPFAYEMLSQSAATQKDGMVFIFKTRCGNVWTAADDATEHYGNRVIGAFDNVEVDTDRPLFEGTNYGDAVTAMDTVAQGYTSYWAPSYRTFPEIDAVASCTLSSSSSVRRKAICMLQYTDGNQKPIDRVKVTELKTRLIAAMTKKQRKTTPIVLLLVTPNDTKLHDNFALDDMDIFQVSYDGPSREDSAITPKMNEQVTHMYGKRPRKDAS